ncbi:NERD domain-containing protein [Hydrogenimonas sp.]|uniref:NERD domain-containing protein n=1 Tax=Hydrogenimonas sp. TaxID=2231112 RepID=UPI00260C08BD|nr:NERD domain-containing protein [Hydrogenimonas sp.]
MRQSLFNFFSRVTQGDRGEREVLESITRLLKSSSDSEDENYFLVPKAKLANGTSTVEIDLTLLHPSLGVFAIEVKNWASLEHLDSENNPFEQVHRYKNILLGHIEDTLGKIPVNVEYRVVFPRIPAAEGKAFFEKNPSFAHYAHHTFFKEDITDRERFSRFFNATRTILPNKKEFLAIASIVVDKKTLEKQKDRVLPIITKDEILFFDHKQLSILNGYTGGFRIIRGVAGTGKTIILTNFVANRLKRDEDEKFLILCFNKRLKNNIESIFEHEDFKKNVAVLSLFELLRRIDFDYEKAGIHDRKNLSEVFEKLKTPEATHEFRQKFSARLRKKPIDLFLCDETQDMPPNILRVIYEEIRDCIFFIDEAQKFYSYSMESIADVFHHPDFEKISMKGRVKNLKNVYRTPSNISRCAFDILSHDTKLNAYYRKSYYLKDSFLSDIRFILEDGRIVVDDYEEFTHLNELLDRFDEKDDVVVLTQHTKMAGQMNDYMKKRGWHHIRAMTFQSIKGLEAQHIVLHDFDKFLETAVKYEEEILFRKVYVLFTRARESLYISLPSDYRSEHEKIQTVLDTIERHTKKIAQERPPEEDAEVPTLSKLAPQVENYKKSAELVVLTAEFFGVVAGLFGA